MTLEATNGRARSMCVLEPAVGDIVPVALATSQMPDTIALPVISQRLLGCSALVAT